MKITKYILLGTVVSVLLLLTVLVNSAKLPNDSKNGFIREFNGPSVKLVNSITVNKSLSRISGVSKNSIFLTSENPQLIITVDKQLLNFDTTFFNIPLSEKLLKAHNLTIDSPYIYLHDNNYPAILYGLLKDSIINVSPINSSLFTRSVQLSPNQLIIRALDSTHQKQLFEKIDIKSGKVLQQAEIIKNQMNGGFSNDGMLRYDSFTKKILFIQYYQNQFFCLDTNLNLTYQGKTIDTVKTNLVEIKPIKDKNAYKLMPATPRPLINRDSRVWNGYLLILSDLKADNENINSFTNNKVLDIYNIQTGQYLRSLYLPISNNQTLRSFMLSDNQLIALYKGTLAIYQIKL